MAIKTFTTGEVLTASDTNTYLANAGLVYVTSGSISNGTTSKTITGAFSSTYTSYMIQLVGVSANAQVGVSIQLSGITTGYDYEGFYMLKGSSTVTGFNTSGTTGWDCGATDTGASIHELIVVNPNVAAAKAFMARASGTGGVSLGVQTFGQNASTSTATDFVISIGASTFKGGLINVYGYRKA